MDSWLCGALSGGQSRSVSLPQTSKLEGDRLYAFPLAGVLRVVLAGAGQLSSESQRLWRLVVSGMAGEDRQTASSGSSSVAASLLIPDLDSENPYDLPRALDRATLTSFVRLVTVQGGWLAIRRGESLEVRAQWNAPACADLVVPIESNPLLRRVSLNLSPVVVHRDDEQWDDIPHRGLKASTRLWACLPLVIVLLTFGIAFIISEVVKWTWGTAPLPIQIGGFLDGNVTGLGKWQAATNETAPAIAKVPRDIVICDWHYDESPPTASYFALQGFPVVSSPWRRPRVALAQLDLIRHARKNAPSAITDRTLGVLQTTWCSMGQFAKAYFGQGPAEPGVVESVLCFKELFRELRSAGLR